jgi:peptidoglycan/LPS O-acetylase OafA/YrhL
LTVAGALTYPFYLPHQRIGYSIIRNVHLHTRLPAWVLVVGTIVVMAVVAWLVHRWVERPLSAMLRSRLRRSITGLRRYEAIANATSAAVPPVIREGVRLGPYAAAPTSDERGRSPAVAGSDGQARSPLPSGQ